MAYTVVIDPAVETTIKGTANQIVFKGKTVRGSAFGPVTVERYETANGQEEAAKSFFDDCLKNTMCMDAERTTLSGQNEEIEVTYGFDTSEDEPEPVYLWDYEVFETSQRLAQHPYFSPDDMDSADAAKLMEEIGACDEAFATGQRYQFLNSDLSADVQAIMQRYAALRAYGVDEWNPVTVLLSCRYRLDSGSDVVGDVFAKINEVVDLADYPDLSAMAAALIAGLASWQYSGSDPTPTDSTNDFVWIKLKPLVKLSGTNPAGPCDITEYYLGVDKASKVVYPGGNWDPMYDVESAD